MKRTIYKRQLDALKATRDMLWNEWNKGKAFHQWNIHTCPLCEEFLAVHCHYCPFNQFIKINMGCEDFRIIMYGVRFGRTRIDETLSIIEQIIDYWK